MKSSFTPAGSRDPIGEMLFILQESGKIDSNQKPSEWMSCLCALTLTLNPKCRTYRFLECLPYTDEEFDDVDVLNAMAHLGYSAQHAEQRISDTDPRLLPTLFIDHTGKPSVVIEKGEENIRLYRNNALETISIKQAEKIIGVSWFFKPYDENSSKTSKFMRAGTGHSWFRAAFGRFKLIFGQVLLTGLFINLLALVTPLFIILIYGRVIASGSVETLPMLAVGMSLAILIEYSFRRVRSSALSWLAARMDNIIGNHIFSHLIDLPASLIERASVAAQIARIKTFESVRDFFCGSVFLSMMEIPYVIISLLAVYLIAGPLALVPLSMAALYTCLFVVMHKRVKTAIRLAAKTSSARQQFVIETFEKLRGIRRYGLNNVWQRKFRALSGQEMMAHFHLNFLGMTAETMAHALTVLSAILTIGIGVHLIWTGQMSTGALVATMILVWRVLTPFYSICTMIPRLEQLRNSIMQVNNLMDLDTESIQARNSAVMPKISGQISFNRALFRYNEECDPIFHNLQFSARAGDLVIVTGENGAGKTTILKLIKSLYPVSEGSVMIDGFDIRQLDPHELRRQIAYVPQQPSFFSGSIIENLRTSNPLASVENVRNSLEKAAVLKEIESLPEGLDTNMELLTSSEYSSLLLHKLSLARAYLHNGQIILIDELPNALLAGPAGHNLKEFLVQNKGRRTCVFITYRDDFLKLSDTAIVMRRGQEPIVGTSSDIISELKEVA